MPEEKTIQIKSSYIHIDFIRRFFIGGMVFVVSFFLLLILMISLFGRSFLLWYVGMPLSLALSAAGFGFVLSMEYILRKLAKTWDYTKFSRLQNFFSAALAVSIDLLLIVLLMIWLSPLLRTDLFYVLFGGLLVFLFSLPFYSFYTQQGIAILDYSVFIEDFKTNPENADFGQILSATLALGKIARKENMEIAPYCLSTGLSVGFLQDSKGTVDNITKLIEWIENPRKDGNFANFKNAVKTYTKLSKILSKEGITEIHRWSFEQKLAISLIAVPSAVGILTVVIPELAKIVPI